MSFRCIKLVFKPLKFDICLLFYYFFGGNPKKNQIRALGSPCFMESMLNYLDYEQLDGKAEGNRTRWRLEPELSVGIYRHTL